MGSAAELSDKHHFAYIKLHKDGKVLLKGPVVQRDFVLGYGKYLIDKALAEGREPESKYAIKFADTDDSVEAVLGEAE